MRTLAIAALLTACAPPAQLRVATWNLRTDRWEGAPSEAHPWPERRAPTLEVLDRVDADLWSLQEVGPRQLEALRARPGLELAAFDALDGDHLALAWEAGAFTLVSRHAALLPGDRARLVVGVALEARDGRRLLLVGTHNGGTEAEVSAVRDFALRFPLPTVLGGDFNNPSRANPWVESRVADLAPLADLSAGEDLAPSDCWTTCGAYFGHVDWLLAGPEFSRLDFWTEPAVVAGVPASDHAPDVADLDWPAPRDL